MIVITEFMDEAAVATLGNKCQVHYDPDLADRQGAIPELLADARALIVRNRTCVTSDLIAAAPRLECVGRLGVGLDNIDLQACADRGVTVYPATGANNNSVAEYVLTAALILLRRAWFVTPDVLDGNWPRGRAGAGRELAGKVLGLIGMGSIARDLAVMASALGVAVVAHDPFVPRVDPVWQTIRNLEIDALLAGADVISLHVPLTEDTRRLIDSDALRRIKPGAVLINAARGGVVDEAAVAAALKSGHLGGAALDTFEEEPLSADRAAIFRGVPNLVLTPHIAGVSHESNQRVSALTAENVLEHLFG